MADYKNCICIACRNEFEPDDDIVVCPDCGTPYHRDCWNEHGRCINTELHETGRAWERPKTEEEKKTEEEAKKPVPCPNCGSRNDKSNIFCTQCGSHMRRTDEPRFGSFDRDDSDGNRGGSMFGTFDGEAEGDPNENMDGVRLCEVSDFVGKNTGYYLPRFRYFRDSSKNISPNLVCIIFPQLWFAYRKMWLWTVLIVLGSFILGIPGSLISMASQTDIMLAALQQQMAAFGEEIFQPIQQQLLSFAETVKAHYSFLYWADFACSYLSLAMHILLFLFGNFLYYRHCIKKVKAVRDDNRSLIDVQSRIRMAGGTNVGFVFLAILVEFALTSVLAYIIMFI